MVRTLSRYCSVRNTFHPFLPKMTPVAQKWSFLWSGLFSAPGPGSSSKRFE
jgi:hypothetical protein